MESSTQQLGKYEVLARLSRGGMAELFLARRHGAAGFTRLVVIKRILPALAQDDSFVQMFLEEARLAARIHHTNVVQIVDLGEEGGDFFLVMELIDGCSAEALLRHVLQAGEALPWSVAGEIVAQACDGLDAAHALRDDAGRPLNLVHRDVSPGNLMISKDGVVKLVDFGIAKAQDSVVKTATGTLKGKYPYMSPEACTSGPVDRRSDIFSLGVTFHELVTGQRIFDRGNPAKSIFAVLYDPVPDPREHRADLPGPLAELILQALERDPARRYQRAAALASVLRATLERLDVQTSPRRLASFLQDECGVLLRRQARLIQGIVDQTKESSTTPSPEAATLGTTTPMNLDGSTAMELDSLTTLDTTLDQAPTEVKSGGVGDARAATTAPAQPQRVRRRLLPLVLLIVFLTAVGSGWLFRRLVTTAPPLRLGLAPSFEHQKVSAELGPFIRYLEQELGRSIELVVDRGYEEVRTDLARGDLDLAILPHMQVLHARLSPVPIRAVAVMRRKGATTYRSLFVVRDNSTISEPTGLAGEPVCWVNRGSASGYLVPRLRLRAAGLDPDRDLGAIRFSGSHLAALKDLLAGRCEAAAVSEGWLQLGAKRGVEVERLRVLTEAGRIPLDHVCVKRQLDMSLQKELRHALLDFDPREQIGRPLIGPHFLADGFATPRPADFATLRKALRQERILP